MSVGGKVIEVIVLEIQSKVWVNTIDRGPTECAIYVELNSDSWQIEKGDTVWWQGGSAYWTNTNETIVEHEIPRIGYSGVSRPDIENVH